MRVLFATTAGAGHFGPLIPFAHAVVAAGHEVLVAAPESFEPTVTAAGLGFAGLGERSQAQNDALFARVRTAAFEEANRLVVEEGFGRLYPRAALPAMLRLAEDWRPDLVVRETFEFSSVLAVVRLAIPCVQVSTGLQDTFDPYRPALVSEMGELARESGLRADDMEEVLVAETMFTLTPPSLENETYRSRMVAFRSGQPKMRERGGSDRPLIYLTFGSEAAYQGFFPDLYRAAIDALADGSCDVLVSIGRVADPAGLGPVPGVQVERWVDHADVLSRVAAVVCHGGYGTVIGALTAGAPLVVLPLFAIDQVANGRRVAERGSGIALTGPRDVGRVGEAARRVLGEPGFADAATRIAAEIAALPPVEDAVEILARLPRGCSPNTIG